MNPPFRSFGKRTTGQADTAPVINVLPVLETLVRIFEPGFVARVVPGAPDIETGFVVKREGARGARLSTFLALLAEFDDAAMDGFVAGHGEVCEDLAEPNPSAEFG